MWNEGGNKGGNIFGVIVLEDKDPTGGYLVPHSILGDHCDDIDLKLS